MNEQEVREFFKEKLVEHNLTNGWVLKFCNGYSRIGYCNRTEKTIAISRKLIKNGTDEQVKNIVLHELAHALAPKGVKHNWQWRGIFMKLGGDGKRTHNYSLGKPAKPINYILTCENGCFERHYTRKPTLNLSKYHCSKCKSNNFTIKCKCKEEAK